MSNVPHSESIPAAEVVGAAPAAAPAPAPESSHAAPALARRSQPSILLLDDDQFMLGVQSRMLRSMDYANVGTAGSAEAALQILRRDPQAVDVIICDLNMPGMDGIEFLQVVNASAFCGNVILLSGEGTRIMHTVQRLLRDGRFTILGALEKPAKREALRALLDLWTPLRPAPPTTSALTFSGAEIGVANSRRQWVLHFQPKVDLRSGALAGLEALVRWNHPEHGLVYPNSFIATAEECGQIDPLTDWVLEEALTQLATLRGKGLAIHMAVNISIDNLRRPDFVRKLGALLKSSSTSPQDVMLEITESRLLLPDTAPLEALVRLRMQRFGLSIDDFGTGHSSLAQLRDVPFSELKVDQGFVRGARHNQIIRPMLEGSVGLARQLGMASVGEGVETEDDWQLLREVGCDFAQGYFIGRPMAVDRVPAWAEAWQQRVSGLLRH